MPELITFRIKGLEKLHQAAAKFPSQVQQGMQAATKGAVELIRAGVAKYPPATAANRAPGINGRWYVRGFGTKTVTGRSYPTSEVLGKSWTTEIKTLGGTVRGVVGTRVSYARYVQDEEKQAAFHTARGWPTAQGVLKERADDIQAFFAHMIRNILQRFGGS
jgi:hypothetical protein